MKIKFIFIQCVPFCLPFYFPYWASLLFRRFELLKRKLTQTLLNVHVEHMSQNGFSLEKLIICNVAWSAINIDTYIMLQNDRASNSVWNILFHWLRKHFIYFHLKKAVEITIENVYDFMMNSGPPRQFCDQLNLKIIQSFHLKTGSFHLNASKLYSPCNQTLNMKWEKCRSHWIPLLQLDHIILR